MAQATFHFPRGFLWGTATASHQVEGDNTNNTWWAWEQEPGRIIDDHKSGRACDWWGGRWKEDFDRAAEAGQNAHRLSIEWSRLQPTPDRWDESSLDYYREMVQGLHERNMQPMVTLHHFSDPLWLAERGGWDNEAVVGYFEAYVRRVVEALKEYVDLWVTLNEPNGYITGGYVFGIWPPGKQDLGAAMRVMTNQVRAHAAAYKVIHSLQPGAQVGIAPNLRPMLPARRWSPLDRLVTTLQSNAFNEAFPRALHTGKLSFLTLRKNLPEVRGTQDFVGINYYSRDYVAFSPLKPAELFGRRFYHPEAELSSSGFIANEPRGLFDLVKWGLHFGLPIMITENGIEDAGDDLRRRYLIQHLHQLWRAVNFNLPVKGYFHWTLVDNFEWERGWTQRFGLWELDVETQVRRKRPSADLYAEICQTNGVSAEMVARFAPGLFPGMFPNF